MSFLEKEITQVTQTVWEAVLGLTLDRLESHQPPRAGERMLSGAVRIFGAWNGALALLCPVPLARQAAATMFGVEPWAATLSETQDAIGELANMTGGNVKALLPEPCHLSLPTVVESADFTVRMPGTELVTEIAFDCSGRLLVVRLMQER
jgi:chemotaxis protein CheX